MNWYISQHAYGSNPIAMSGNLGCTSNSVFSNWQLCMSMSIYPEKKKLSQNYKVVAKPFRYDVLFESSNLNEMLGWIEEHKKEIEDQVRVKAVAWFNEHPNYPRVECLHDEKGNTLVVDFDSREELFKGSYQDYLIWRAQKLGK